MAVLGLRFCARAFSSCGKRGPLFIAVRGPLTIAASLVAEHMLQTRRLSNCGSRGPVTPRHVGSSQTRAQTRVPCISRQTLNHCATREAPVPGFWKGTGHGPGLHQLMTESWTMTGPLAMSKVLIFFLVATVPLWKNNAPLGKKTH